MEKRSKEIKIRLTESEHQSLLNRSDMPRLAEWIRNTCLDQKETRKSKIPKIDPELLRALSAIGNNVNQMAKAIHTKKQEPLSSDYLIELNSIYQLLNDIKEVCENNNDR